MCLDVTVQFYFSHLFHPVVLQFLSVPLAAIDGQLQSTLLVINTPEQGHSYVEKPEAFHHLSQATSELFQYRSTRTHPAIYSNYTLKAATHKSSVVSICSSVVLLYLLLPLPSSSINANGETKAELGQMCCLCVGCLPWQQSPEWVKDCLGLGQLIVNKECMDKWQTKNSPDKRGKVLHIKSSLQARKQRNTLAIKNMYPCKKVHTVHFNFFLITQIALRPIDIVNSRRNILCQLSPCMFSCIETCKCWTQ